MKKKNQVVSYKIKKTPGEKVFDVINYAFFGLFAFICAYPFYYILINTISSSTAVSSGDVMFWPIGFNLSNYKEVFKMEYLGRNLFNSVARVFLGTALGLLSSSFLGYAFTRMEMWHRKFWYRMVTFTMYFGAGFIPTYLNIKSLGFTNNFLVYVIPGMISPYNMILFKTFVESIPASLEESAQIDGAGYLTRYARVVLPLCKPILATLAIFTAVGQWNSFMDCILYVNKLDLYVLQARLRQVLNEAAQIAYEMRQGATASSADLTITPLGIRFTIAAVTTIPILVVYPYFQKYFTGGIMIGAVKG